MDQVRTRVRGWYWVGGRTGGKNMVRGRTSVSHFSKCFELC